MLRPGPSGRRTGRRCLDASSAVSPPGLAVRARGPRAASLQRQRRVHTKRLGSRHPLRADARCRGSSPDARAEGWRG
jgi:hypothetical protein